MSITLNNTDIKGISFNTFVSRPQMTYLSPEYYQLALSPTQLCWPRPPLPSIKPLPRGPTSQPAERAQVRPPAQVTADSSERDQSRPKASECKRVGSPPFSRFGVRSVPFSEAAAAAAS